MRLLQIGVLAITIATSIGCSKSSSTPETVSTIEPEKPKYQIDLSPGLKPGFRTVCNAHGEFSYGIKVEANGEQINEGSYTAGLDARADMEVLAVDAKAVPTWLKFTVRSSNVKVDGKQIEGIAPGTMLESKKVTGKELVSGLPFKLEPEVHGLTETVFAAAKPGDATIQEVFGTDEPRSIGEKWDINLDRFRKEMSSAGFSLRNAKLTGTGTLLGITDVNGTKCLHVQARGRISDFDVDLPKEVKADKALGTLTTDSFVALVGSRLVKENASFDVSMNARRIDGLRVLVAIKLSYSRTFD